MQLLSFELAKELHDLCEQKKINMPQSTYFYFGRGKRCGELCQYEWTECIGDIEIKAYSLDEIINWLPKYLTYPNDWGGSDKASLGMGTCGDNYQDYLFCYIGLFGLLRADHNPCDAACKLLIQLIKEGRLI